jgi:hypothetical protein
MARLLGVFIAASLYLVAVYHLTNLYFARQEAFAAFILLDGGIYPLLFWGGYVLSVRWRRWCCCSTPAAGERARSPPRCWWRWAPSPGCSSSSSAGRPSRSRSSPATRSAAALPTARWPATCPRWPEFLLGVGGLGAAFVMTVVGVRVLDFMPQDDFAAAKS